MTRDELYALIADHVTVTDEWGGAKIANWQYGYNLCVAGIDEATDAIMAKLETSTNWQPIETAPKDGTPILVIEPETTNDITGSVEPGIMLVEFREYELYASKWTGWCVPGSWQDEQGGYCEANRPTHWMLLPETPK